MLAVFAYCHEDEQLAYKQAEWIASLGTVESHQALICCDKLANPELAACIKNELEKAFRHVVVMHLRESAPGVRGANLLFKRALRQVQASNAGPFLWLHPDAVPLREGWLDAIEAAWKMLPRGKHFLGCHLTGAIPHMGPVAVYPPDAEVHAPNLVMAELNPFHLNAAPQVVPKMAATSLIRDSEKDPLGLDGKGGDSIESDMAVLWHGSITCKTGELIDALRKLPREDLRPLGLLYVNGEQKPQEPQEPQEFAVPEKPLPVDRSAQQAASRAGSDGIPADEIDTSTQVPRTAPPMVNPVRSESGRVVSPAREFLGAHEEKHATAAALTTAAHEVSEAAMSPKEDFGLAVKDQLSNIITPANVEQFAAALADFRDKSPAQKAAVLASLRAAGFKIVGKTKKGRR